MKLKTLTAVAVVAMAATGILSLRPRVHAYTAHYENVLGTSMELRMLAGSEKAANTAEAAVLASIEHDAKILSTYDPESEFSRWFGTRDRAVPVSPELFAVLAQFDAWRGRTAGALDPAAENVLRVWKQAVALNQVPSDRALASAVQAIRQPHWRLDPVARTATHLSDTPLILNSFVKSYIIDRAATAALASAPIDGAVVNVGGDIVTRGRWTETVGVTDPLDAADNGGILARLALRDRAVATSGGYRRGFDIQGQHYSHIVDPRTGRPTGHVLSATVVAGDGVSAGALATSLCVMPVADGEALASHIPGAEFLMVLADGSRIESAGWRGLTVAAPARLVSSPVATLHAAEQTWNPDWELTVGIELTRPAGMAKRPYVAVWVEDKDKFPVRTIALWFDKTRYLPELRAWYRGDRLRAMAEGSDITQSVSSATRSPGRYTFKWDGKDQQGKLVKAGTYTVFLEVTREHGTYQILHQEMDFGTTPKHVDFQGNTEIAGASLDFHRVAGR